MSTPKYYRSNANKEGIPLVLAGDEKQWYHLDAFASLSRYNRYDSKQESSVLLIVWSMLDIPSLLVIIGVLTALLSYSLSSTISIGSNWCTYVMGNVSSPFVYIVYTLWCLFLPSRCLCFRQICRIRARKAREQDRRNGAESKVHLYQSR